MDRIEEGGEELRRRESVGRRRVEGESIYCFDDAGPDAVRLRQGSPPWEVVYRIVGSKPITLSGIKNELHSIDLKIPDSIAKRGGQFSLALGTFRRRFATA